MCGGTVPPRRPVLPACGLSPRVRGNRPGRGHVVVPDRSIPACAGEPTRRSRTRIPKTVYPRVCGGTAESVGAGVIDGGLSPRVRGNHQVAGGVKRNERSIPACAGEPASNGQAKSAPTVYPRVCGGTYQAYQEFAHFRGLSPRVRGNRARQGRHSHFSRSIPACAGEPGTRKRRLEIAGVYPRVCGGTQAGPELGRNWAGTGPVYPRVCGGTIIRERAMQGVSGLSPRVRGNPFPDGGIDGGGRSIPACAGEPGRRRTKSRSWRVYPRVCGGTGGPIRRPNPAQGLSPRVRGNPAAAQRRPSSPGSIPACAGEPVGLSGGG